jgi:hypothetical protein
LNYNIELRNQKQFQSVLFLLISISYIAKLEICPTYLENMLCYPRRYCDLDAVPEWPEIFGLGGLWRAVKDEDAITRDTGNIRRRAGD